MITKEQARQHIVELLQYIGENTDREGLRETPDRILKMWGEIFRGYDKNQRPKITTFQNGADGIVYDNIEASMVKLIAKAANGDIKAIELIREILGENVLKTDVTIKTEQPLFGDYDESKEC